MTHFRKGRLPSQLKKNQIWADLDLEFRDRLGQVQSRPLSSRCALSFERVGKEDENGRLVRLVLDTSLSTNSISSSWRV